MSTLETKIHTIDKIPRYIWSSPQSFWSVRLDGWMLISAESRVPLRLGWTRIWKQQTRSELGGVRILASLTVFSKREYRPAGIQPMQTDRWTRMCAAYAGERIDNGKNVVERVTNGRVERVTNNGVFVGQHWKACETDSLSREHGIKNQPALQLPYRTTIYQITVNARERWKIHIWG